MKDEYPWKTVFQHRKPKSKAHLSFADVRRAVAVVTSNEMLTEDVQVWVWGTNHTWVLVQDLKKGEVPPWTR